MPVEILPPEILSSILERGLEPYTNFDKSVPDKRRRFLSSVCLVSAQWRDVAYQTPQFWSLVALDFDACTSERKLAYQTQTGQLARSKKAPLDIILSSSVRRSFRDPGPDRPEFWAFWSALTERYEQWRSIRISKIKIQSMEEMHDLFPPSLPNLTDARTRVDADYTFTSFVSAPRLRRFELRSSYLPFVSGESVIHLTNELFLNHSVPLLPTCSALQTLHLDDMSLCIPYPTEIITLPSLQYVSVTKGTWESLNGIIAFLDTPHLHTLSFEGTLHFYNGPNPMPPIIIPSLQNLRFKNSSLVFLGSLTRLLRLFPNLETIALWVSFQPIPWSRRETSGEFYNILGRKSFDIMDKDISWLEGLGATIIWQEDAGDEERPPAEYFRNWQEARDYFEELTE